MPSLFNGLHFLTGSFFARFRIRTRIAFGFGLLLLLLAASDGYVYFSTQKIQHTAEVVTTYRVNSLTAIKDLRLAVAVMHNQLLAYRLNGDPANLAIYTRALEALSTAQNQLDQLQKSLNPEEVAEWTALRAHIPPFLAAADQLRAGAPTMKNVDFKAAYTNVFIPALYRLISDVAGDQRALIAEQGLSGALRKGIQADVDKVAKDVRHLNDVMTLLLIVSMIGAGAASVLIGRSIVKPVERMRAIMGRVAAGEEDLSIPGQGRQDELGDMARALAEIRDVGVRAERLRCALDSCGSNITVVDLEHRMIFINKSMHRFIDDQGYDMTDDGLDTVGGKHLSDEQINKLCSVSLRHAAAIPDLTKPMRVSCEMLDRDFECTLAPTFDRNGKRLSTVIEWVDVTERLRVEAKLAEIVAAAAGGDLDARFSVQGQQGIMRSLCEGINALLGTASDFIGELEIFFAQLAADDLSVRVRGEHGGRFAAVCRDANISAIQLEAAINRIVSTAGKAAGAAREIAAGATDLSLRTEQQASNIEETSKAMESLAVSVRQNSGNAQEASRLATAARYAAERGAAVTEQAVSAMELIEGASRQVIDIVAVLDEITFQTNMLAVNAAVEASRAGEVGRGFAVLAGEVRALSQRSSEASREIKGLIASSSAQVSGGVQLVRHAGDALSGIVDAAGGVASLVAEIASATVSQAGGIEQVSQTLAAMEQTTQANAQLALQSAMAVRGLDQQSIQMLGAVSFFPSQLQVPSPLPSLAQPMAGIWQDLVTEI